ncbi:FliA/WhiG family RNA polymerase sigma factor [Pseudogracilibacillus sp. SE30717A]|uniref:FliA/WhiG family RNA polymerase sigma factor n=1 Tax=Pseudogracilibacillus sp. SE30717A TaxID=3098293 RepID=UPI00300E117D
MDAEDSRDVQTLWTKWMNHSDEQAANELINYYMYLVQFHVERIASYLPVSIDKNDLKSMGLMGLYDALHKFEPDRNLKFDTYATIRVRGSIIDGLRKEDWLPRTLREQSKKIEKVTQELEQRLMRTPNSQEIAQAIGKEPEEVEDIVVNTLAANVLSIDASYKTQDSDETDDLTHMIVDDQTVTPDQSVIQSEQNQELVKYIKQLNENEQLVISLFYHEELTLTEIGHVLNLTTSRISQIHKRAIFKLKDTLTRKKAI